MSGEQVLALIVFCAALAANAALAVYFAKRIQAAKIPMQWDRDGNPTWYAGRTIGLWWQFYFALAVGGLLLVFARYLPDEKTATVYFAVIFVSVISVAVQAWHLNAVTKWAAKQ